MLYEYYRMSDGPAQISVVANHADRAARKTAPCNAGLLAE